MPHKRSFKHNFSPTSATKQYPRPPLIKRLNRGWQRQLTLVSAPAGYGKTTLISDWLGQHAAAVNKHIAWLSLDEEDNDLSRTDPPLGLARLRARQQLVEIGQADLRFSERETAMFLKQMGLQLKKADRQTLTQRTEGWITGLQLAALSLQEEKDSTYFRQFSGTHCYILDYLLEEILQRQPDHLVNFLLQTAIAPRLSAPLCQAITGRQDSQNLLAKLEQKNLFTISLDHDRRWYHYHHLFAHFLQHRLAEKMGIKQLHQAHLRASQWHEACHNIMVKRFLICFT